MLCSCQRLSENQLNPRSHTPLVRACNGIGEAGGPVHSWACRVVIFKAIIISLIASMLIIGGVSFAQEDPAPTPPSQEENGGSNTGTNDQFSLDPTALTGKVDEHVKMLKEGADGVSERLSPVGVRMLHIVLAFCLVVIGISSIISALQFGHQVVLGANPVASIMIVSIFWGMSYLMLKNYTAMGDVIVLSAQYLVGKIVGGDGVSYEDLIFIGFTPFDRAMDGAISAVSEHGEPSGPLAALKMIFNVIATGAVTIWVKLLMLLLGIVVTVSSAIIILMMIIGDIMLSIALAVGPLFIPFLAAVYLSSWFISFFWAWASLVSFAFIWKIMNAVFIAVVSETLKSFANKNLIILDPEDILAGAENPGLQVNLGAYLSLLIILIVCAYVALKIIPALAAALSPGGAKIGELYSGPVKSVGGGKK